MNFTKADMLIYLSNNVCGINILPIYVVDSDEFFDNKVSVLNNIVEFACNKNLIIRSSCDYEDTLEYSNAGKFESVLNVSPDYKSVEAAIERVYESYGTSSAQKILVQPMLEGIVKSGVVFTSDMETYADYYIVNYHEGTDTAAVTSGSNSNLKTFVHYKHSPTNPHDIDMGNVISVCSKIENFLQKKALDIEFAITSDGKVYIFQVRDIAVGNKKIDDKIDLTKTLERIYKKIRKLNKRHPFLLGGYTCFGVMPDWNPAEILGIRPKKLAISLYKELITDNIWAHQRYDYGYRDLTMHPLMVSFCGVPFIDTRITFNSFVPRSLNSAIAEKLVNYYLDTLADYPKYHDKIEFEIVYSCYYFGLHDELKKLLGKGFTENEIIRIEFSLLDLTNSVINPSDGAFRKDIVKIKKLERNYQKIIESDISLVDRIYWLIEECKSYGTLPFAGVARAAFIAVQFLKSFIRVGIITQQEYSNYMETMNTVNKRLSHDLHALFSGKMSKECFLETYGHIRPGTYDIMSLRYDEDFEGYFSNGVSADGYKCKIEEVKEAFEFSACQKKAIQRELDQNGILIDADELLDFIKDAIEGREYLKFVFTKAVSQILKQIEELGNRVDIGREELAHLDISVIKNLYSDLYTGDVRNIMQENIKHNKLQYTIAKSVKLPSLIVSPEDVYSFFLLNEEPNYITQKNVTAATVSDVMNQDLAGKIVFVQSADPGYDFLFSHNIGGLITQFGGANSHMAIRCAEMGIPAIIGAGERNYNEWSSYDVLLLDCLKKQVIPIR